MAARCPGGAATAWYGRPRRALPRTRSPRAPVLSGRLVARPASLLAVGVPAASPAAQRPAPGGGQNETFAGVLWCDGRRRVDFSPGARVEVRRGSEPVLLARLRGG